MRRWFKLWVVDDLHGPVRYNLSPAERSVWLDLRCLACESRKDGLITAPSGKPYTDNWLATTLNVPRKLVKSAIEKLQKLDQVVVKSDGIWVTNWYKMQSDYDRQKPYRQGKPESQDPDKYVKGKYGHMVRR